MGLVLPTDDVRIGPYYQRQWYWVLIRLENAVLSARCAA